MTKRHLRSDTSNWPDIGGVPQTGNIHVRICAPARVAEAFATRRESPAKAHQGEVQFRNGGQEVQAEDLTSGNTVIRNYADFSGLFGYFLPFAGISTERQVPESVFDIKATGRLNRLYVEPLKDSPDWGSAARRPDVHHVIVRMIFCIRTRGYHVSRSLLQ